MGAILSLAAWLTGCAGGGDEFMDYPVGRTGSTNASPKGPASAGTGSCPMPGEAFQVGDVVVITYAGMEPVLPEHKETVKDNGYITPPLLTRPVRVLGRTPSDVQRELHAAYTNIYQHPTVTVQPALRYYTVAGEVLKQGPQVLLNETSTDIVMAIAAAGGFNEFAQRRNIQITRACTHKVVHVDYRKAIKGDPKHDVLIYPGDRIFVPRTVLF